MLSLLRYLFTSVCVSITVLTCVAAAVTMETVVGFAGRRVTLPCRLEEKNQRGVEVCWGRGEPSLFTCHNTVVNAAGEQMFYRKSYRYSVSPSSSLSILSARPSDSGLYHCRVQLPGLFNDQISTVHLIIINLLSDSSSEETSELPGGNGATNTLLTTTSYSRETGSDVSNTGPMVGLIQSAVQQPVNSLQTYIGNTVRLSLIVFIPALLLTAVHRVWRSQQRPETDGGPNRSEDEEESCSL
ncbi:hepatitis A virus cellular receptor 1 homolog [Mastacembelus armatus]|uniref:hepatitis A virus cellular receptor 1 homolog n=1 Tax=Mastacembelus armatus TaxID=205130 RepID=UPI000E45EC79|nr:hepatitis A virus cellular receptor 1 homolog [Mastacembelus armatus]